MMFPASRARLRWLALVMPGFLAACSSGSGGHPKTTGLQAPAPSPLETAVNLLNQGDEAGAQKQIKLLLKRDPNDPSAHVLLESITQDPVGLLGAKSYPYTVQPTETLISLSERFLGNRLKFYQLARYNHIVRPVALTAGTALRIPGEPPRSVVPVAPATSSGSKSRTEPKAAAKPGPVPSGVAGKAVRPNPAAAQKLRSLGLAALNQGKVDDAVSLLRRASALDPGNALIVRDLSRAERIAGVVKARR
jgi:tetratricopeptide (TPR) repeat protein